MAIDVFFDMNVLVYFASDDVFKAEKSAKLLRGGGVISVQVMNEFASVGLRKSKVALHEIQLTLQAVTATCKVVPLTIDTHEHGLAITQRFKFAVYDSMIIAAALLTGCKTLYSEDMQHGQVIDGLRIVNPYK